MAYSELVRTRYPAVSLVRNRLCAPVIAWINVTPGRDRKRPALSMSTFSADFRKPFPSRREGRSWAACC